MALLVQKYGGTSVCDIEKIQYVAQKIMAAKQQGYAVVVVVSAMQGETDRLDSLAHQLVEQPSGRELDALLATGEQVSAALMTMALQKFGCAAKSLTGHQIGIKTCNSYTKARILAIEMAEIESALAADKVVVVAGFQGIDIHGNITTLGRGGSDTTAVALASALNADECQIFTDVDGIYTADPKLVPQARKMKTVTFEEMLELSSLGAKVLQIRAVEFAGRYQLPVRVLSTFKEDLGTLITFENGMEQPVVSGIVAHQQEAKLVIRGIDDIPGVAARILTPISQANIEVDMITQSAVQNNNKTDLTFTVHQRDYKQALQLLTSIGQELGAQQVFGDEQTAKLSLVGIGMRSHTPIASRMFEVLGQLGVNIQLLSTSETKVSVLLDEKYIEQSVRALHSAFNLHTASVKEHMVA